MTQDDAVEDTARRRLRSLRLARGWSIDELASRSDISPSTISRLETGNRRLALDHLATLARSLDTTIDELLVDSDPEDVIIHPTRDTAKGATYWILTRPDDASGRLVAKIRLPARKRPPDPQVHPGRDWFYVIKGTVRLLLGEQEHLVGEGQAAEFDTMTPHWMLGYGEPAEILTVLDRHGERTHLRSS